LICQSHMEGQAVDCCLQTNFLLLRPNQCDRLGEFGIFNWLKVLICSTEMSSGGSK
jgi:hypothetical protein